mmetsp:Transcript_13459/g.28900  ORF Transcript_13459/g.28900 Transcript_13459/m.28900 type:complete len:162 (+) Transcript_13459:85-570(+)
MSTMFALRSVARPLARRAILSQAGKKTASPIICRTLSSAADGAVEQNPNVVVPLITDSLEWTLSSPPPLHQFTEPPLMVECEHLSLQPGAEVEEILEAQGETVTDIIGKEGWVANDPALYEGLIPQNASWTEFVDEKTGEWVYMDEFGQRVDKPIETYSKE